MVNCTETRHSLNDKWAQKQRQCCILPSSNVPTGNWFRFGPTIIGRTMLFFHVLAFHKVAIVFTWSSCSIYYLRYFFFLQPLHLRLSRIQLLFRDVCNFPIYLDRSLEYAYPPHPLPPSPDKKTSLDDGSVYSKACRISNRRPLHSDAHADRTTAPLYYWFADVCAYSKAREAQLGTLVASAMYWEKSRTYRQQLCGRNQHRTHEG
jgi:hypothetical protein